MTGEPKWPSFAWRDQVRNDPAVTNFQWRLADWIAEHVDKRLGCVWRLPVPGSKEIRQAELARLLGCSIRTLHAGLRALEQLGHLAIESVGAVGCTEQQSRRADGRRHGNGSSCRYRPFLKSGTAELAEGGTQIFAYPPRNGLRTPTREVAYPVRTKLRTPNIEATPLFTPQRPLKKSISLEAEFEEWYAVYPRRCAKRRALAAHQAARNRGATREELIDGARRYAAERSGKSPEYTKHPATWLNGDCWTDEPEAPSAINGRGAEPATSAAAANRKRELRARGEAW